MANMRRSGECAGPRAPDTARRALATVTLLLIVGRGALLAGERTFSATVSFQDGVNNYEGGWDDSLRPGKLKLVSDVKRELDWWHKAQIEKGKLNRQTVLEGLSSRHPLGPSRPVDQGRERPR